MDVRKVLYYSGKHIPIWWDRDGQIAVLHSFDFFTARCIYFINDRCTRCLQAQILEIHVLWARLSGSQDSLSSICTNRHWVPAYAREGGVKRLQGLHSSRFLPSLLHCGRFCTIAFPNVVRFILIHAAHSEKRISECHAKRSRAVGTCRRFCQRSPCTFFRSCLMPRGRENKIIMLRGAQVCRWAIVHIECILPDTEGFSLWE